MKICRLGVFECVEKLIKEPQVTGLNIRLRLLVENLRKLLQRPQRNPLPMQPLGNMVEHQSNTQLCWMQRCIALSNPMVILGHWLELVEILRLSIRSFDQTAEVEDHVSPKSPNSVYLGKYPLFHLKKPGFFCLKHFKGLHLGQLPLSTHPHCSRHKIRPTHISQHGPGENLRVCSGGDS